MERSSISRRTWDCRTQSLSDERLEYCQRARGSGRYRGSMARLQRSAPSTSSVISFLGRIGFRLPFERNLSKLRDCHLTFRSSDSKGIQSTFRDLCILSSQRHERKPNADKD